jgi:hypothetical protein
MGTRFAVVIAFAVGLGAGVMAALSLGPTAAQAPRIAVTKIDGLDDRIRAIAEECVIVGAGTSHAHLTCRRDAF